jgi:hypothetical protein
MVPDEVLSSQTNTSMKSTSKRLPGKYLAPTYARAFEKLGDTLSKATTASDMTTSDKIRVLRIRLFGSLAEEVIAAEDAQGL